MKTTYILVIAVLCGCSNAAQSDCDVLPAPPEVVESCVGIASDRPCTRNDGLPGHCAYNRCVISCDDADDCPASTCRANHCVNGACEYLGVFDGTECFINGVTGSCESFVCVVLN